MEQKRERERMAKPVVVLTAKEITAPPPPPPPAAETSAPNRLPNLAMSDNGSDAGDSDDGKASVNDDEVRKRIKHAIWHRCSQCWLLSMALNVASTCL